MRVRIHFAVGSTAMAKTVDITDPITLQVFADRLSASRHRDAAVIFNNDGAGGSFALPARSIVLLEELQ